MDNAGLIDALKRVPETNLRLLELARESVKEDGSLDVEKLTYEMEELQDAIKEAQSYSEGAKKAVSCLKQLAPSSS